MQRRRRRGLGPSHPLHPALSDLPCLCSALGAEGLHHQDVQREDLDEPLQFPQLSDLSLPASSSFFRAATLRQSGQAGGPDSGSQEPGAVSLSLSPSSW